jgi:hypothetical protein
MLLIFFENLLKNKLHFSLNIPNNNPLTFIQVFLIKMILTISLHFFNIVGVEE